MLTRVKALAFFVALALAFALVSAPAGATLDTAIGAHVSVPDKSVEDCSVKARDVLTGIMQSVVEAGDGSGIWIGSSKTDGAIYSAAVIECHPGDPAGFTAAFTCMVQTPPTTDSAATLCNKLTAAYTSAVPSPAASGAKR